jgi:hypothetical protein
MRERFPVNIINFLDHQNVSLEVHEFLAGIRESERYSWMAGVEAERLTGQHDFVIYLLEHDRSPYSVRQTQGMAKYAAAQAAIARKVHPLINLEIKILDGMEFSPESAYRTITNPANNPNANVVFCGMMTSSKAYSDY